MKTFELLLSPFTFCNLPGMSISKIIVFVVKIVIEQSVCDVVMELNPTI